MKVESAIALVSAIISLGAVIVAIVAIRMQDRQFKKQREPIIAPATRGFNVKLPETHLDWTNGQELEKKFSNLNWTGGEELNGKFSDTTIPIYNYGGTTVFNVMYTYKFINVKEVKQSIDHILDYKDYAIKIESIKENLSSFTLKFKNDVKDKVFIDIGRYIKREDLIQPGEKIEISLPSYFLIIANYAFKLSAMDDIERPILELTVLYTDINYVEWEVKHKVRIDDILTYSGKEDTLESAFISEFVSKIRLDTIHEKNKKRIV